MIEQYYELLVNRGPIVTIIGFLGFYAIMIYGKHQRKTFTSFDRYAFLLLFIALLPNFLAHFALMIVHGAYMPFVAEVVNIVPVIYYVLLNEYYLRKEKDGE